MSDPCGYMADICNALEPLGETEEARMRDLAWALFVMVYPDLERAVVGNPVIHHITVLSHMAEMANPQHHLSITAETAVALSLLHDISPVDKITTQMVDEARNHDPERAKALELTRKQNRVLHMREGSGVAHRRMLLLNKLFGRIVFDEKTIDAVCDVIRIHDNPSLKLPIPKDNSLAVAFREADRLWMITHEGILTDLRRKEKDTKDKGLYCGQLEANVKRFREERQLYCESEEEFVDKETFFRTETGHNIYKRLYGEAKKHAQPTED